MNDRYRTSTSRGTYHKEIRGINLFHSDKYIAQGIGMIIIVHLAYSLGGKRSAAVGMLLVSN